MGVVPTHTLSQPPTSVLQPLLRPVHLEQSYRWENRSSGMLRLGSNDTLTPTNKGTIINRSCDDHMSEGDQRLRLRWQWLCHSQRTAFHNMV